MKNRWVIALTLLITGSWAANASISEFYGWEDGQGSVVGSYGNVASAQAVMAPNPVRSGNYSLALTEAPLSGTPQAFLAFIEGLTDGDVVTASFWGFDDTPDAAPSLRIWGHYATSGDVDSYNGSASGSNDYTGTDTLPNADDWFQVSYSWTFDSSGATRDALVIEARLYSDDVNTIGDYFIDDLTVEAPPTASIMFPVHLIPEPSTIGLLLIGLLSAGLIRSRRR